MPWDETDREKYAVVRSGYATDVSDEEFALFEPLLPAGKVRGRPRTDLRLVLNALLYLIRGGVPWRLLPKDFPPYSTVQNHFYAWRNNGIWDQIVALLVMQAREAEGREASPTAVIVDSQSVKTTEAGGEKGYDAGKKIKGRKRHLAVDILGLPIVCQVTTADVQDRDALADVLKEVSQKSPFVTMAFADGGYQGDEAQRASFEASHIHVTIVKRTDKEIKGFVVVPKRWVVERTFGWLNRARRLAKDYEKSIESSHAWLMIALVAILIRRLARPKTAEAEF